MPGRPPASYAYPKIWGHLDQLGFLASHRGLIKLRHLNGFVPPYGSVLSNRFFELKYKPDEPHLVDYMTVHDVVEMISFHMQRAGKPRLNAANEVVCFDHQIKHLPALHGHRLSEHENPFEDLAHQCGLPVDAIVAAARGRLLPRRICERIVAGAGGDPANAIKHSTPSSSCLPANEPAYLADVLHWLAA